MEITTMVCVLVGILVAGFLGLTFITQWAQIHKSKTPSVFDWLAQASKESSEEEE